ncbi:MAG: DUF3575 domain-containing protein, partial [Bacteroidetes bacterium]
IKPIKMKMKKVLFLFAFALFAIGLNAQSNVIKANPIGLAFGNFNATYEKVLNDASSVLVKGSYRYSLFGIDVSTFGIGAGYRFYITNKNKPAPGGFYVQPQASFSGGSVGDSGASYTSFGVGAELGYQWVWDSGFVLDLGLGPNYTVLSGEVDDFGRDSAGGILPSATLAIGYAF